MVYMDIYLYTYTYYTDYILVRALWALRNHTSIWLISITTFILRRELIEDGVYLTGKKDQCKKGCFSGMTLKYDQKCFAECDKGFEPAAGLDPATEHEYRCEGQAQLKSERDVTCVEKVAPWQFMFRASSQLVPLVTFTYALLHTQSCNPQGQNSPGVQYVQSDNFFTWNTCTTSTYKSCPRKHPEPLIMRVFPHNAPIWHLQH